MFESGGGRIAQICENESGGHGAARINLQDRAFWRFGRFCDSGESRPGVWATRPHIVAYGEEKDFARGRFNPRWGAFVAHVTLRGEPEGRAESSDPFRAEEN
jgi:hypothetical protein